MRQIPLAIGLFLVLTFVVGGNRHGSADDTPHRPAPVAMTASATLPSTPAPSIHWHDNYRQAIDHAQASRKLLLIWFVHPKWEANDAAFEQAVLGQPEIIDRITNCFVAARLPIDTPSEAEDAAGALLNHESFAEMLGLPGFAILDLADEQSLHFRRVVSVYPFGRRYIPADHLAALLDLPSGTLTQRTLIFAVRTHPERPASATSDLSPVLALETENHARYQASIALQGHHNWESRFHYINARLPAGLVSQEVCAESWPGQNLVEAAEECVASWRQSSGHWEAVSSRPVLFGYDMKRGRNGVWYATGIFARRG